MESIGTSELILVAIVALIFLGPRKLPEIARKAGKIMADFRNTTNEFKSTWEREVNLEVEETVQNIGKTDENTLPRVTSISTETATEIAAPEIKVIDKEFFDNSLTKADDVKEKTTDTTETDNDLSDKRNWL